MTPQKKYRLKCFAFSSVSISLGAVLLLFSLKENMMYFYTPSDLKQALSLSDKKIRLGGKVKEGSLYQDPKTLKTCFEICDEQEDIRIHYHGILPDLFREGQGVVVEGVLKENNFHATLVLAKHDENYMPPEVAKSLKSK